MFNYHIYLQDVCIGDVNNVNSEDSALTVYALRTGVPADGLTAVQVGGNSLPLSVNEAGSI